MKSIDYLKTLAIISVIILHSVSKKILLITLSPFHIWNAVPIFIILSSFTTYISSSKNDFNFKKIYSLNYFKKKFIRIILPIIFIFICSLILGLVLKKDIYLGPLNLIGLLPITGPGNYYVTILLQYIIISPIYICVYKKRKKESLIGAFVFNIIIELLLYFVKDNYLYSSCIFRYTFLIFLGFYLYEFIISRKSILKNKWIIICFAISFLYLISTYIYTIPFFNNDWKRQIFIANFYPLLLVYLGIKYLPNISNIMDKFAFIGKSSYHIFLVQILYFTINPVRKFLIVIGFNSILKIPLTIILNLIICILLGVIFYQIEKLIMKCLFKKKESVKNE